MAGDRPQQAVGDRRPPGHAEGQEVARRLIATADVLVENFRPGTLERWGLGYDELSRDNPGLVMTRVTGYGQHGPYASRAGFGSIGEAMGGLRHLTGDPSTSAEPHRESHRRLARRLPSSALGTSMALVARGRTGTRPGGRHRHLRGSAGG